MTKLWRMSVHILDLFIFNQRQSTAGCSVALRLLNTVLAWEKLTIPVWIDDNIWTKNSMMVKQALENLTFKICTVRCLKKKHVAWMLFPSSTLFTEREQLQTNPTLVLQSPLSISFRLVQFILHLLWLILTLIIRGTSAAALNASLTSQCIKGSFVLSGKCEDLRSRILLRWLQMRVGLFALH